MIPLNSIDPHRFSFTEEEKQVFLLIAIGCTTSQIKTILDINSDHSFNFILDNVQSKLGTKTTADSLSMMLVNQIIPVGFATTLVRKIWGYHQGQLAILEDELSNFSDCLDSLKELDRIYSDNRL